MSAKGDVAIKLAKLRIHGFSKTRSLLSALIELPDAAAMIQALPP